MPSLDNMMLRQIIMDHYENPRNHELVEDDSYKKVNMDSETCIDNIDIQAKIENGVIDEARVIIKNYMNMIFEKDYDPEILEEAIAFYNTHKQANRIKCATLGWKGITQLIDESEKEETHGK